MDFVSTIKDAPEAARAGAKVLKEFSAVVSKSGDAQTLTFQCSTGSVDRHGDRVIQAGLDTANFIKTGGPCLWSHDYQALPIGRAVSLGMNSKGLTADILFADHPFAKQVYDLALGGFLRAVSIGFIAKDYVANGSGGYDYESSELIEISIVCVPAQAEAIRLRSLAAAGDEISAEDFEVLAHQLLDDFEARLNGDDPERVAKEGGYISEADFRVLLEAAGKQLDEWKYRNLGILPEE